MKNFNKDDFDPKAAREARKAELEDISKRLEEGVLNVYEGDNYKEYLKFCSKLPKYSINNQILIMMQRPDATMCQSFNAWKSMGRTIKKGEKGIRILAPAPFKIEKEKTSINETGEEITEKVEVMINSFKPVSTFDVSQTEGPELPSIGVEELLSDVDGYDMILESFKEIIPVPVTFEDIQSGAKGYFNTEENRIAIKTGMSEAQTIKTLIHEASHQALHSRDRLSPVDKKTKEQKEVEAESVAFIVCSHLGIDTSEYSFGYLAGWSTGKEVRELKDSLETIRKCASDFITKIDDLLLKKEKEKEEEVELD